MRTLTLTVDEAWNGSTVKHLLRARLHMAEGLIARVKLRETGLVRNGERVFTNARLRTGDVLCVEIGDEGAVNEALPIAAPLTFVYEDEDIAVLNKSPDMAVHGSTGGAGVYGCKRPCRALGQRRGVSSREPARPWYLGYHGHRKKHVCP